VRATATAIAALSGVLAAPGCGSSTCYPDCAAGYEPVPNACACRPVSDAATPADGSPDAADPATRKRVFHLLNGALGAIKDANDTRTGMEVADADCTTAGQTHGGGTWRAWLSDSSMNAIDRLADVGPMAIEDPTDASAGVRSLFWSGTLLDGTASTTNCSEWTSYVGGGTATVGRTDTAGSGWVDPTPLSCSTYLSLLCFEQ